MTHICCGQSRCTAARARRASQRAPRDVDLAEQRAQRRRRILFDGSWSRAMFCAILNLRRAWRCCCGRFAAQATKCVCGVSLRARRCAWPGAAPKADWRKMCCGRLSRSHCAVCAVCVFVVPRGSTAGRAVFSCVVFQVFCSPTTNCRRCSRSRACRRIANGTRSTTCQCTSRRPFPSVRARQFLSFLLRLACAVQASAPTVAAPPSVVNTSTAAVRPAPKLVSSLSSKCEKRHMQCI